MTLYTGDFKERFAKYVSGGYDLEESLENCLKDYEDSGVLEFPGDIACRLDIKRILRMELTQHMIDKDTILSAFN